MARKKQIYLICPQWSKQGKLVQDYEKRWEQVETEFSKVSVSKYSYIDSSDSDRLNKISDSSILLTRNKIMILGRNRYCTEDGGAIKCAFDKDTYQEIDV